MPAIYEATEAETNLAFQRALLVFRDLYELAVGVLESSVESPIEMRLGIQMLGMGGNFICPAHVHDPEEAGNPLDAALNLAQVFGHVVLIEPQARIGRYRIDFRVTLVGNDREITQVLVECDGHDFHEKTRQQAAHDKRRSRELLREGSDIVRFTGSEIFKNAAGCADEVWETLRALRSTRRKVI